MLSFVVLVFLLTRYIHYKYTAIHSLLPGLERVCGVYVMAFQVFINQAEHVRPLQGRIPMGCALLFIFDPFGVGYF